MQNQGGPIAFAELEVGGGRVECPRCHVPFTPHLGHWMAARFKCESCTASLSYRNSSGRRVICPCCSLSRPLPKIKLLVCTGCDVTVLYQKGDLAVKCSLCKHITNPPQATYVPQLNRVVVPQVNRVVVPPQAAETESTDDSFDPKPENSRTSTESVADYIARFMRDVAHGIGRSKREVEEDQTESESKKIRR